MKPDYLTNLTKDDGAKALLAIIAGVPIDDYVFKDGKYYFTTVPCAIININGQLTIVSMGGSSEWRN